MRTAKLTLSQNLRISLPLSPSCICPQLERCCPRQHSSTHQFSSSQIFCSKQAGQLEAEQGGLGTRDMGSAKLGCMLGLAGAHQAQQAQSHGTHVVPLQGSLTRSVTTLVGSTTVLPREHPRYRSDSVGLPAATPEPVITSRKPCTAPVPSCQAAQRNSHAPSSCQADGAQGIH